MKIAFKIAEAAAAPVYAQMAAQIDRHLRAHGARPGARLPDLRALAAMAGVSLKTADRALQELMRRGVCVRRPKKGTFFGAPSAVPCQALAAVYHAQGLHSFESDLVQASVYRGIARRAAARGLDLFFLARTAGASLDFYQRQENIAVRGVAMLHWEALDAGIELAARFQGLRFVYINYWIDGFADAPSGMFGVFNDDAGGAYQMTEHLLRHGGRRIAFFGMDMPNYRRRLDGYRRCLLDNGLPADPRMVNLAACVPGHDLRALGAQMARDFFMPRRRVAAVFCANDVMAAGVCDWLRQRGADARVRVAGYDNIIPALSRENNFSTMAIDFETMGEKAVDLMARPRPDDQKIIRIAPRLIVRN